MNKKEAKEVIENIAWENKTTIDDVIAKIQKAIDIGYSSSYPDVQKNWKSITDTGRKPTPEETIISITKKVNQIL